MTTKREMQSIMKKRSKQADEGACARRLAPRGVVAVFAVSGVLAASFVSAACRTRAYNQPSHRLSSEDSVAITPENAPRVFRDIFYTHSKGVVDESKRIEAVNHQVFLPTEDVMRFRVSGPSSGEVLQPVREKFKGLAPRVLFEEGRKSPPVDRPGALAALKSAKPVTIVIIPGIFGEFIKNVPFQEVFDADSAARRAWEAALKQRAADKEASADLVYSLEKLAEENQPLKDIVKVASLDGADGRAFARIIFLKPEFGSLESLLPLREASQMYKRRLGKVFKILGEPEELHLMGYSRGALVAMDMASLFARDGWPEPWMRTMKGVISLAGPHYGSGLADEAMAEMSGNPNNEIVRSLNWLLTNLEDGSTQGDAALNHAVSAGKNSYLWASETAKIVKLMNGMPASPGLQAEKLETDLPNAGALMQLLTQFASQKLRLERPVAEYYGNVKRFREFGRKALSGVQSLTADERVKWWKSNTVPGDLKYYFISGTMADPTEPGGTPSPLLSAPWSFNTKAIDYSSNRKSYYDLVRTTGQRVNDSQVTIDSSVLWPHVLRNFNAQQKPLKSYWMGILGTDHWGMAFPKAFETVNGGDSPYPRTVLLKSIATFLALTQED